MAQILVRELEDQVRDQLRERARARGVSMEEEVRCILRAAVATAAESPEDFLARTREAFAPLGFDGEIPEWRGFPVEPADLT